MSINRYDKKRDANEPQIIEVFEKMGISVFRLDRPVDLLLGYRLFNYLVEVKIPGEKLNKNQVKFQKEFKGSFRIIRTIEEAATLGKEIKSGTIHIT